MIDLLIFYNIFCYINRNLKITTSSLKTQRTLQEALASSDPIALQGALAEAEAAGLQAPVWGLPVAEKTYLVGVPYYGYYI